MKRSRKALGQEGLEALQSIITEMLARRNDKLLIDFITYLDSTKATTSNIALLLVCLYEFFCSHNDDLELNALFQEAFMTCGQIANDYKSFRERFKDMVGETNGN